MRINADKQSILPITNHSRRRTAIYENWALKPGSHMWPMVSDSMSVLIQGKNS